MNHYRDCFDGCIARGMAMIPVPVSDEAADNLHDSYESVKIYVDGLRPANGVDFFDANGEIALTIGHARWSEGTPNEVSSHDTGLSFYWKRVDDVWSDVIYVGVTKRCICI